MDIENNYEQELVFKIENENKIKEQKKKERKVVKLATEQSKRLMMDRINGRTGDC